MNRKHTQGRGAAGFQSTGEAKYTPVPLTYSRTPFRGHPVEVSIK